MTVLEKVGLSVNLFGLFVDLVVLGITTYTFWLTFFSKNIKYVGYHIKHSLFFGNEIIIYIDNKTLHTITIRNAYLFYKDEQDNTFYSIGIIKDKEPISVEAWHACKLTTSSFTGIGGVKDLQSLFLRSVLYLETFNGFILVNMKNNIIFREDEAAIRSTLFRTRTVFRNCYKTDVLSKGVKYALNIYDENGKFEEIIYISNNGLLSKPILGYNSLPRNCAENEGVMIKTLDSILKCKKYQLVSLSTCI